MLNNTNVRHNTRCVYRLIARDLYSAPTNRPLAEQEYTLEKANVLDESQAQTPWRVMVRNGEVCLEGGD